MKINEVQSLLIDPVSFVIPEDIAWTKHDWLDLLITLLEFRVRFLTRHNKERNQYKEI